MVGVRRFVRNVRRGRTQKALAAATALSVPALAFEIYFEHYKGSFGDKWMWTPLALTPPLTAAGIGGVYSERVARTWLPLLSTLYALDGLVGIVTHVRGVHRRPGGIRRHRGGGRNGFGGTVVRFDPQAPALERVRG